MLKLIQFLLFKIFLVIAFDYYALNFITINFFIYFFILISGYTLIII